MKNKMYKRIMSVFLTVAILISGISSLGITLAAETTDSRIVDPSTMDNYKKIYGSDVLSTAMAGGVWSDKSVFTSADAFNGLVSMNDPSNNFLVALSTIASNKSIVGYSNLPTDTMLVLDISGSMSSEEVQAMVTATNNAITTLQQTNYYNRVGVVLYSGNAVSGNSDTSTASVLLPLDRYTHENGQYLVLVTNSTDDNDEGGKGNKGNKGDKGNKGNKGNKGDKGNTTSATYSVSVNSSVVNSENSTVAQNKDDVIGGTYIQNGVYQAMEQLLAVADTTISSGLQAGTKRIPIIVLMSDGAPTAATSSYDNVGSSHIGNGTSTTDEMVFLTQLTASYAKSKVAEHYDNDALFYTLGLGVSTDTNALAVLDPQKSSKGINDDWTSFLKLQESEKLAITTQISVTRNMAVEEQLYVDEYFPANDAAGLISAFDSIVQQIIIQSLYFPTLIENGDVDLDGYIEFIDRLGLYMDVKDVKGIILGDTLYTGERLAKNFVDGGGDFGTVDTPTELGDNFIWSVKERLGITSTEDARDLVHLAYEYGQLSYSDSGYSNYIGWYADKDGKYLGFWHEGHTSADKPTGAVYTVKSYGMLGDVVDGHKVSDMMYVTIRVLTSIEDGSCTVKWNVPASLIPVISYNVSFKGTSLDDATDIKIEIDDKTPIRLVYEIGVRDDITPFNITEKVSSDYAYKNADGTYTFYTNQWDLDAFNNDIYYLEQVNTVSYFEPSFENERFYYTQDAPIYVKDGTSYKLYTGTTLPDGDCYRAHSVFKITDKATGAAEQEVHYDLIYAEAIAKAVKRDDNNSWYIPKGTVLPSARLNTTEKTSNNTKTISYSGYPTIELAYTDSNDAEHYYIDAILGNNGKITVSPARGIKISKQVEAVVPGTNTNFEFTVTSEDKSENGTYQTLFVSETGTEIYSTVTFKDGAASLILRPDQSIYIVGLPTGVKFTVSEHAHPNYTIKTINGNDADDITFTIENNVIHEAAFVNRPIGHGALIVSKKVEHPFGSDYTEHQNKSFTFEVDLGVGNANKSFTVVTSAGSEQKTTDGNGIFTISLKHGESAAVEDIPENTKVTVTENDIPAGFSAESTSLSATIDSASDTVLNFTNTYSPAKVSPVNITLTGEKSLTGRQWLDTDSFTFTLQRLDGASWVDIAQTTVNAKNHNFDFTSAMQKETYLATGTYFYRLSEVEGSIGGVSYDTAHRYFDVVVSDDDMDGKLEIKSVVQSNGTTVTQLNSTWNISANVGNTYEPKGEATVSIDITKYVENNTSTEISKAGFVFGLYNQNTLVTTSKPTDTNGKTQISLTFPARSNGENIVYTLKEIIPDEPISGMNYTSKTYTLKIEIIDNLDGTVSAVIYDSENVPATKDNSFEASFVNGYEPKSTVVNIDGTKKLDGRELNANEFEFELYETGDDFVTEGKTPETVKNNEAGYFSFEQKQYTTTGTHYYVVKEKKGTLANVYYDETAYNITVVITDDNGVLVPTVTIVEVDGDEKTPTSSISFVNTYTPDPTTATISGKKELEGRELSADEFTFDIFNADVDFTVLGEAFDTANNAADGTFSFGSITYTKAGTYHYVVRENATAALGGITYDKSVYHVTVTVTDDGNGTLTATVAYADSSNIASDIVFKNTYTAKETYVELGGTKVLEGRELLLGEFKFDIYEADESYNKTGTPIRSTENLADGRFNFDRITYTDDGIYRYVIVEDSTDAEDRVTYDTVVYKLTVTVEDDGKGNLTADVKLEKAEDSSEVSEVVFNNIYTPRPDDITVDFNIKKTVKNTGDSKIGPQGFEFELLDTKTNESIYVRSDENGNAKFTLSFTEDDIGNTYTYKLTEVDGKMTDVTYSDAQYLVSVSVTLGDDNKLVAKATVNGTEQANVVAEFENIYDYHVPYTGDDSNLTMWLAVLFTSGMLLFSTVIFSKKRKNNL